MKTVSTLLIFFFLGFLSSCGENDVQNPQHNKIKSLRLIGEQILPTSKIIDGQKVGGLSGIDYANNQYYVICDASNAPIRFYTMDLEFNISEFSAIKNIRQVELLNKNNKPFENKQADPESIRFDSDLNQLIWTSEGFINNEIHPFIRSAEENGKFIAEFTVPKRYLAGQDNQGPRHNGVFEGLTLSKNRKGYWTAIELPLVQDGDAPVFGKETNSPIRVAFINKKTGKFEKEFAYELDSVARDGGFEINGVVEILQYAKHNFLFLERSFASGTDDGGNNVKIYDVNTKNATDISKINALKGADYTKATKTLLFDFEDIRNQLSQLPDGSKNIVDNIEGITFGPILENGNRSLVLVSDNNFNDFGAQLNQFIVFEVIQ